MKTITMSGLSIMFDADQVTSGNEQLQALQAIEQINLTLQREPYGLAAQIVVLPEEVIATVEENSEGDAPSFVP